MIKAAILALGLLSAASIAAADCPQDTRFSAEKDQLHARLLSAKSAAEAQRIGAALWTLWVRAPDARAQTLLDRGRAQLRLADYDGAINLFTALIDYCPTYAEGWNQRGFAHFLRQDYAPALKDIAAAIAREPRHFGALAGQATTLLHMGRRAAGFAALRRALKVNPWLAERYLLPKGQDI